MKLVSRVQLDFACQTMAEFTRTSNHMRAVTVLQAQHVALIVTLRAIGHVLKEVDADTPKKRTWLARQWSVWQSEPIFSGFIKPDRDSLLKEFGGFLDLRTKAFGSAILMSDPRSPGHAAWYVSFDPDNLLTSDGRPAVQLMRDAVGFWDCHLSQAEDAFATLPETQRHRRVGNAEKPQPSWQPVHQSVAAHD